MATMESINAKSNAGLATGIIGTSLGALATGILGGNGGILGNILGGQPTPAQTSAWNTNGAEMLAALALMGGYRSCGCESDHVVTRFESEQASKIAALESQVMHRDSTIYTDSKIADVYERLNTKIGVLENQLADQRIYNATNTAVIGCIQSQIAQLMSLTKLVVPNSSVCPGWGNVTVTPSTTTAGA